MDVRKIGEAIRFLRLKEGYTQQNLADYLNISYQAVSKWERGLCMPDTIYISKLAELLNVDLDDLLDGNITYLDDEWKGVLLLTNVVSIDLELLEPIYEILISYFMLAGIRRITIFTEQEKVEHLQSLFSDRKYFGLEICYQNSMQQMEKKYNTMLITDLIFLYGSNLTKYFWRAMSRKDGISVLTAERGNGDNSLLVEYNRQFVIKPGQNNNTYMLPVMFIPRGQFREFDLGLSHLIQTESLYAEPTARGLINYLIQTEDDIYKVMQLKAIIEFMTGEKIYDLDEIAKARRLI